MPSGEVEQLAEPGLGDLFAQLRTDVEELARAELALVKARTSDRIAHYRAAAILFAAAGVLSFAMLIALLVGLIFTLSPITGPGGATAIVVGVVLLIVIVLALLGRAKLAPAAAT